MKLPGAGLPGVAYKVNNRLKLLVVHATEVLLRAAVKTDLAAGPA